MKNTLRSFRGDLRVASIVVASLVTLGGLPPLGIPDSVAAAEIYTVRLAVDKTGFAPARVSVPLGTVHFVVTAREGDHCFAIPSVDVEKRVRTGKPLEVDVTFDRAGEYPFLCCVESSGTAETGVIVVASGK